MNERVKADGTAAGQEMNQTGKRLGIREFVLVLVIILVVWAAQKCYSVPPPPSAARGDAVSAYGLQVLERTAP